jgi:hypothetical protein
MRTYAYILIAGLLGALFANLAMELLGIATFYLVIVPLLFMIVIPVVRRLQK